MISRRNLLAASAMGAAMVSSAKAASFGNPDEPPQGAVNAKSPGSLTDPGPQNPVLAKQFPSAQTPPATGLVDHAIAELGKGHRRKHRASSLDRAARGRLAPPLRQAAVGRLIPSGNRRQPVESHWDPRPRYAK